MIERKIIAPESPRAVIVLVHGMSEHKERYYPFMNYLSESGYATVIADTRGHGPSCPPEDLGWFGKDGAATVIEDTAALIKYARETWPGLKVFLLGHSMGSMTVRCILKRHPELIDGLVVVGSPSWNPATPAGILLTKVMALFRGDRFRSNMVTGMMFSECIRRFKDEPFHNAWLSTNYGNVEEYNADPLCGFKFTLNGYRTVMQLMAETYSPKGWAPATGIPVHFASGEDDPFINTPEDFRKAVEFVRSNGYKDVSSTLYKGMRHEILNEVNRELVWADLKITFDKWL